MSEAVLDFWGVLKIISVIQCLFFSSLIITTKSENPKARKYLLLFLLVFALLETDDLFFHSRFVFQIPHWIGLVDPLACTLGPLLYFYTSSLTNSTTLLRKQQLLYLLPTLFLFLLWGPVYLKSAAGKKEYLVDVFQQEGVIWEVPYPDNLFFITVFLAVFLGLIFLALSSHQLYRFDANIRQLYSSIDFMNLRWLRFLLVLSSLLWLSAFLGLFFNSWVLEGIDFFIFPIFIFLISYYDVRQKRIPLSSLESLLEKEPAVEPLPVLVPAGEEGEVAVKYAKSGIREGALDDLAVRLKCLIEEEKVHTNSELSLQELAERMETSTHHLSQLLNEKMNQSFYEFINYHRVQEVKRKLASEDFNHLKMLAIAFESGFNSKTTFNAAFKKYTGLSPSEYRKGLKSH